MGNRCTTQSEIVDTKHVPITVGSDISQLLALEANVEQAFNDKDVDALMTSYARRDALFVFDVVGPPGMYSTWDAYRDALQNFFDGAGGTFRFVISDLDIRTSGDLAYGHSLQHLSGVTSKDGDRVNYTVRVTDVFQKLDGRWLIVQEHVSLPLDRGTLEPTLDHFPKGTPAS